MFKLGWFSSGRGAGSRALLEVMHDSIADGSIDADIAFVFCNREPGQSVETDLFFEQVRSYNIPLICHSSKGFREKPDATSMPAWRIHYDREVMQRLDEFGADLCVLAGYMLIVGEEMCRKYIMINLHPAAPEGPAGTWKEVIWQLIDSRAHRTGVMMHLVIPELDKGPPLSYCEFDISRGPFQKHWKRLDQQSLEEIRSVEGEGFELFRLIREHGLKREFPLIVNTVKAFCEKRVGVLNDQIVDGSGRPIHGYDLTAEIDQIVS